MTEHFTGNGIPRIDPRRPFTITPAGLVRITLGATQSSDRTTSHAVHSALGQHAAKAKPQRACGPFARCMLVAAYADRGALDDHARQTLAAAALLADTQTEVVLIVLGTCTDDVAALGADKCIVYAECNPLTFAPDAALRILQNCVAKYRPVHLLMPDRPCGEADLGRRLAALTDSAIATRVVEIASDHVAVYADDKRQFATRDVPNIVLLAPNAVNTALPFVGAGVWVDAQTVVPTLPSSGVARAAVAGAYRDFGIEVADAARLPLEEADAIVAAGNGVHDVNAFERLAVTLGAAVGASRVAVDDGRFTRDKQIGATGKTVEASVYIAFGISGAVQHLQGIKSCRHVIAVNTDASAPIAARADLMIVDDAAAIIAGLTEVVRAAQLAAHETWPEEAAAAQLAASRVGSVASPSMTNAAARIHGEVGVVA